MSGTRRNPGGLGLQVEGYRAWLLQRGYTPSTVRNMLKELGQVGRWLTVKELEAEQLDEQPIAAFIAARHAAGYQRVPGPRAMAPLLSYLREVDIVAEAPPLETPMGLLLAQYRTWLVGERGLAPSTVLRYENTARDTLAGPSAESPLPNRTSRH